MKHQRYHPFVLCLACLCALTAKVFADQSDTALLKLYTELANAADASQASELENRIWEIWLQAPDEASSKLLMQTTSAMGQNDWREALILATRLTTEYPDYAEGWNKRATLYYLMGNFDDSVKDIYETLRREPKHFGAISGLGLIFQRQGNLEGAIAAFEQVLSISPQSPNAQRNLEQLKQEAGSEI